ncbi:hypothetical protein LNKW23_47790 [Paralimibaculum aggregatum]|uniref:VPLPA-CTERM sorting domain-containing protein n=1 Tax=Paralimibaculum aggregatum TaxID=3036245 RepID=A0ABQ6LTZ7_9RHOB|nr:PEP-CTERM sorting domain-containing protein [Limibaculum sp. NKW23]GMG85556.1 hypothetical protein LNKW23_47790 [Limibaculum sp. NKW23]
MAASAVVVSSGVSTTGEPLLPETGSSVGTGASNLNIDDVITTFGLNEAANATVESEATGELDVFLAFEFQNDTINPLDFFLSYATNPSGTFANLDVRLAEDSAGTIGVISLSPNDGTTGTLVTTIGAGVSRFLVVSYDSNLAAADAITLRISTNVTDTNVPLPAALPLLLVGLAGVGFVARRRAAA